MAEITEDLLKYRGGANLTVTRWPYSHQRMISSRVAHLDGIHSVSMLTHEESDRRQTVIDLHHVSGIEAIDDSLELNGEIHHYVTLKISSGEVTATITLHGVTMDRLINAVLAERVGESLLG